MNTYLGEVSLRDDGFIGDHERAYTLAQGWCEGDTHMDFDELPQWLRDLMVQAAAALIEFGRQKLTVVDGLTSVVDHGIIEPDKHVHRPS